MSFIRYKYKIWHTFIIINFYFYIKLLFRKKKNCDFTLLINIYIYDKHLGTKHYFIFFLLISSIILIIYKMAYKTYNIHACEKKKHGPIFSV